MPIVPPVYKTKTLASRTCFVIVELSMIFEETQHSYSMFALRRLPAKASGETEEAESSSRACHVAARFASLV